MRALRFHAAHDLRVEELAEPPAPAADDVLVKVAACGICGTDLHEYAAGPIVTPVEPHPLTGAQNPQILGHEFAGEVLATGPAVTRVHKGDRVDHVIRSLAQERQIGRASCRERVLFAV